LFDKPDPLEGPFFEETIYVTPSRLPAAAQDRIAECTAHGCRALGLTEGPVHAELRLYPTYHSPLTTHRPYIIEINPRSIGGLCSRVLRFGTGLSLEELIIRHTLDRDFVPPARERAAAGVMMIPVPEAGVLSEVRGVTEAQVVPGIEQVVISARLGQELVPLPEVGQYVGFIFAHGDSPEQVEAALRQSHARLEFSIGS
jgi:biotin carboxylase